MGTEDGIFDVRSLGTSLGMPLGRALGILLDSDVTAVPGFCTTELDPKGEPLGVSRNETSLMATSPYLEELFAENSGA